MGGRRQQSEGRVDARRWALRFAALLAVFLQVFVVQTHVHALAPQAAGGYETALSTLDDAADTSQIACALCQAQAESSSVPAPAVLPAVAHVAAAQTRALEIRRVSVARAYSWRSRAPPNVL
jgi:hypothetical protein